MEYKVSEAFVKELAGLACLCDESDTDSLELAFKLSDGRKLIIEMTFREEGAKR